MSFFRRRTEPIATSTSTEAAVPPAQGRPTASKGLSRRPAGPLDATEVDDTVARVDLGALRLPGVAGMELRLEVEDGTRRVVAATVALGTSSVQLQAFAAPRTRGIWEEVREEITASLAQSGGAVSEQPGPYGPELVAAVPAPGPDGRTSTSPARFVGVDGPRWFLRAVFSGAAALDSEAAAPLEALLRDVVVVRGAEAMAPRDLLPLHLPTAPQGAAVTPPPPGNGVATGPSPTP